jgi:hypothetical protein
VAVHSVCLGFDDGPSDSHLARGFLGWMAIGLGVYFLFGSAEHANLPK